MILRRTVCGIILVLTSACAAKRPDYALFYQHKPQTILILPPLNNTASVDASYKYFSTLTQPLAERGYYVIPVAVADRLLKENGVIGPEEMRMVPRDKLLSIFGADAVLDSTIDDWGTSYIVFSSSTTVAVTWRLLDLRTGKELWSRSDKLSDANRNSGGGLAGALVGALTHAISSVSSDNEVPLAQKLNDNVLMTDDVGLLPGGRWVEKP